MDIVGYLLSRSRTRVALGIAAGVLSGLGSAGLLGVINSALHSSASAMGHGPLVFGGLGVLVLLSRVASTVTVTRLGQAATRDLRMELSRRIIGAPLRLLQELGTPRVMANLTEDVSVVAGAFQLVPHLCINIACVLGCLVYLGWLSWGLFIFVAGVMALGVLIYRLSALKAMGPLRASREQDDALYAHFRALTQGIKEIPPQENLWVNFGSGRAPSV